MNTESRVGNSLVYVEEIAGRQIRLRTNEGAAGKERAEKFFAWLKQENGLGRMTQEFGAHMARS